MTPERNFQTEARSLADQNQSEGSPPANSSKEYPDFSSFVHYLNPDIPKAELKILEQYYNSQVLVARGAVAEANEAYSTLLEKYGDRFDDMEAVLSPTFYIIDVLTVGHSNHKTNEDGHGNYWVVDPTTLSESSNPSEASAEGPHAA